MDLEFSQQDQQVIQQLKARGALALSDLFAQKRERLKKMMALRLDKRLLGRVDGSDIVQEAYIESQRRLSEYLGNPHLTPLLWLRRICHAN